MLYDPFMPTTTQQSMHEMTLDSVPTPTRIPNKTTPIAIPTRTARHQPSLYADYTDYGEVFFEDALDYDALNEMVELQRLPNRRDSGYETPRSPVDKLQREELHATDFIPAMWAGEHDVSHHVSVSAHRHPRRSSSLLQTQSSAEHNSLRPKDALPHSNEASCPSQTLDRCPTCKAALKWKYLTEQHPPPVACICQAPAATSRKRTRRDACGEEESLARMSRFVEEHISWPVEL